MAIESDLFALDIGTRTVTGIVYQVDQNNIINIRSIKTKEHQVRSMFDGQIHDIDEVGRVVYDIKTTLEKRLNITLTKVSLAAAGRALKTEHSYIEKTRKQNDRIIPDEIKALELQSVQKAQKQITEKIQYDESEPTYHCVGYSVVNYKLNGYPISNLVSQKGNSIGVEVIATFLPQVVIDGLEGVMENVGLEISTLTLEPIAALNLVIPSHLRMLNLALLDIGAGTSDIAITSKGTVIAYRMVPKAGDEITDKICQELLVDFPTGEKIKHEMANDKKQISFQDVLGVNRKVSKAELVEFIYPVVTELCKSIADAIKQVNGKSPGAVFCVGGGSELPLLTKELAVQLELAEDKVAIKGNEKWSSIKNVRKEVKGPRGVTPLGIALTSILNKGFGFFYVTVNQRVVRMLSEGDLKVADALMVDDYPTENLIPSYGKGCEITVNGEKQFYPGTEGSPAQIYINGEEAHLETVIKDQDYIQVIPAKPGDSPNIKVSDIIFDWHGKSFYLNNKKVNFPIEVTVNDNLYEYEQTIPPNSQVNIRYVTSIKKLMKYMEIDMNNFDLYLQDQVLNLEDNIPEGAEITILKKTKNPNGNIDTNVKTEIEQYNKINVHINGELFQLPKPQNYSPKFLDIFNVVDFDTKLRKGQLIMTINKQAAEFTDPIKDGDDIYIYWSEEGPVKLTRYYLNFK